MWFHRSNIAPTLAQVISLGILVQNSVAEPKHGSNSEDKMDTYTKTTLTVIAIALSILALKNAPVISPADAQA
jgi:hypothetical protein